MYYKYRLFSRDLIFYRMTNFAAKSKYDPLFHIYYELIFNEYNFKELVKIYKLICLEI